MKEVTLDDKDLIQEFYSGNALINRVSTEYRKWNDALYSLVSDPYLKHILTEARYFFTHGDQLAKEQHFKAIQYLEEGGGKQPQMMVPQKYHVNQIWKKLGYPIYIAPFFAKCLAVNKIEYTWDDKRKFIDKIAKDGLANAVWMFLYMPYPEQTHIPHPLVNGFYDIQTIDPNWWLEVNRVFKYCHDRRLHIIVVIQGSSGTTTSKRRWDDHWLNQKNNHGFNGKTYDDHHGLLKWINFVVHNEPGCTPERREWYRHNMEYFMWFWGEIIPELHKRYKDFFSIYLNEIDTGEWGHNYLGKYFQNVHHFPRWRMISSPRSIPGNVDWINEKPSINKYWVPSVHYISNHNDYLDIQDKIKYPFILSDDGTHPDWSTLSDADLRKMIQASLIAGNRGFMGRNWIGDSCNFNKLDYRAGRIMMEEVDRFLEGK